MRVGEDPRSHPKLHIWSPIARMVFDSKGSFQPKRGGRDKTRRHLAAIGFASTCAAEPEIVFFPALTLGNTKNEREKRVDLPESSQVFRYALHWRKSRFGFQMSLHAFSVRQGKGNEITLAKRFPTLQHK